MKWEDVRKQSTMSDTNEYKQLLAAVSEWKYSLSLPVNSVVVMLKITKGKWDSWSLTYFSQPKPHLSRAHLRVRAAQTTPPSLMIHKLKDAGRTTACFLARNCTGTVCNIYFMKNARLTGMQFDWFRICERKEKIPETCLLSYESKPPWSNASTYQNVVKEPGAGLSRNWVAETEETDPQ